VSGAEEFIIKKVVDLIAPVLEDMDFELVDTEYLRERGRWVLRIFIDKEGGVTLGDCVAVNREIGDLIDVKDIIPHQYVLEVSSPGVNRPLKKEKDFATAIGRKIKVKTNVPVGERKNFSGYLEDLRGDTLSLLIDGELLSIPLKDIRKANIIYEF
jgi:ribosome maturation factor RimP